MDLGVKMNPLNRDNNLVFRYFWNILISVDQFFNTVLGGDPDETMSSRFGKWLKLPHTKVRWKIAYVICRVLHVLDSGHCDKSIEEDEGDNAVIRKR